MPLNYSKWDNLEVSDDSDIEGHPNVDHKSLVRMKQRTIHEQRHMRNTLIAQLEADLALNNELAPRARALHAEFSSAPDVPALFSRTVERLKTSPSADAQAPGAEPYDTILYHLLLTVFDDVKKAGVGADSPKLGPALLDALMDHITKLEADTREKEAKLDEEKREKAKKITTEDIHEGFDSKYVPAKPEPPPIANAIRDPKGKGKQKETSIEVLNAPSAGTPAADAAAEDDSDEEDSLPQMTPALTAFSKIGHGRFQQSYEFIQAHREVIVPGAADALLVAAFDAQSHGRPKHARQCVHQSLLVQYCEKLGGDGVRVFFMKMISGDKRATDVFLKDVEDTYAHLVTRVAATQEEAAAGGGEQIQLVAEGAGTTISFNVPDGPPPAELVLEGEGTEDLDIEEVRKVLQMRWDVFSAFPDDLKEALRANQLEAVNAVLGKMPVPEAEQVVSALDMASILNFAEGGIRDETPAGKAAAEGEGAAPAPASEVD